MQTLRIDGLVTSDGALREGVLYDLVGRLQHDDARVRSVAALGERYHVDQAQATRVKDTAESLLQQLIGQVDADPVMANKLLRWAGHLHEIGLDIAHADFHLHGAYVVEHADLPGFPAAEQQMLAYLLANQRKQPSAKLPLKLSAAWAQTLAILVVLLRLSVLINRNRSDAPMARA